jgi:dTDP-4-dehydrorhamnose 3,5-epimerase
MTDDVYTILNGNVTGDLIHDVVIHRLEVHGDPRGTLTEGLKTTWTDVYEPEKWPFTQMYFSTTKPGVARDVDRWHYHPGGQQDRFGVIRGDIVVAVLDNREGSKSEGRLNLFHMGESLGEEGQYVLMIPPRTLHGYVVVSESPATMFNFPTKLYDKEQEVRVPMSEVPLTDGKPFEWDKVISAYQRLGA